MKLAKQLLLLFAAASLTVVSCKKDDDDGDDNTQQASIVGTWEGETSVWTEDDNGVTDGGTEDISYLTVVLNADNSYSIMAFGSTMETGTWSRNGSTLNVGSETYTILSLTQTQCQLRKTESSTNYTYTEVNTFSRQ